MRRRAALLALCALAVAGCGERGTSLSTGPRQPLRVAVTFPNAGEASVYAAKATGGFRNAGLDVRLLQEGNGASAVADVKSGRADLAVSTTPDLLEARDRGARVVSVAALVQSPLASLITLKAPEHGLAALASKPIGTAGFDYQKAFAQTIFKHPVRIVREDDLVGALSAHKVSAIVGAYSNYEGIRLDPLHPQVRAVDQLGVPRYPELVLVANQDALSRDADAIRAFVGALARATHGLRREDAALVASWLKADPKIPATIQRKAMGTTLGTPDIASPLTAPPAGRPFGWQVGGDFTRFAAWMRSKGLLHGRGATAPFTNAYLPGQGL
jgi:putative hydroxymethylpyrimidine transport system substrate-binding protein